MPPARQRPIRTQQMAVIALHWQPGAIVLISRHPGLWLISESMVADVCEHDRWRTGRRTEGIYSATYAWILKGGIAFALLIAHLILEVVGFDVTKGAAQSPGTLLWLRILFAFLPACARSRRTWPGHRPGQAEPRRSQRWPHPANRPMKACLTSNSSGRRRAPA